MPTLFFPSHPSRPRVLASVILAGALAIGADVAAADQGYHQDFENASALNGWTNAGDVAIDPANGFQSAGSLRLTRTLAHIDDATSATTPPVPVIPGTWAVSGEMSAELESPDSSYNAGVTVVWLGADGKEIATSEITALGGKSAWKPFRAEVETPANAANAELRITFNKTNGTCHVDDLALAFVSAAVKKTALIDRITWTSASFCNIIRPTDAKTVTATIEALSPLTEDQRHITWQVRDYWGAEVGPGGAMVTADGGQNLKGHYLYNAKLDLSSSNLEEGKYYEIWVKAEVPGQDAVSDHTTLAILPEPASHRYPPSAIPFTARNWNHRCVDHPRLSDAVGQRNLGMWGGFSAENPTQTTMPLFDDGVALGMDMLSGVPSYMVENHVPGYEKYTPEIMRNGVRAMLEKYGHRGLTRIDLGNEPPGLEERAREAVPYYQAVYEEVKKFDPNIQVIGTSIGPNEGYFKAGFQNYLDVFDFHVYEDTNGIRKVFADYAKMFEKYHCKKPIVSTELGLNSQGLSRLVITDDMVRKISVFFALGGLHCSWFDLFYPDPEGTITGTNGDSFNAFNCKYCDYSPRLDGVMYYNLINSILIKKCLGEKLYDNGVLATMWKDDAGACFMTLDADQGHHEVFIPLPGTGQVKVIRVDGSSVLLDAGGTGITLSVANDPLLLLWQNKDSVIPADLGAPTAELLDKSAGIIKGSTATITLALDSVSATEVAITTPENWTVAAPVVGNDKDGKIIGTWTLTAPAVSSAREGRIAMKLGNSGEIYLGIPVIGQVSTTIFATATTGADAAGVKLHLHNNSGEAQTVHAVFTLVGESDADHGNYDPANIVPTKAFFAAVPDTTVDLAPGADADFAVPLGGLDPHTIYRVRAVATDQSGIAVTRERMVAGFATVPRAATPPKIDGVLDEADWGRAQVLKINEDRQFFGFNKERVWRGPQDLSADLRLMWDDDNLYVGVVVTDDVFRNDKQDGDIWAGDGLQFLFDPCRESPDKIGKYDLGMGYGKKGWQAWSWYSADPSAPTGEVTTIKIMGKPATDGTGGMTYELAIPWARLAPFKPAIGRNLGMAMILNDDDGKGRDCFMGWFSGVSGKEVDVIGDLVISP